jgi:flagellar motor switch protein FliG
MESMPPVRVQEVQAKQLEIVQIARQMQDDERISLAIVNAGPRAN